MTNGFEYIKLIYEEILRSYEILPDDLQGIEFVEYVSSVYDKLVETKYKGHEKFALHGLKISSSKLKELILDTIFANLYCEFFLMLHNLDEHNYAIRHEIFLTSIECNENFEVDVSQKYKERFRRRMQPNRLNLINKVKIKSNDEITFYSPSLIRAFKETLFIPRPNTNVLDISENYADIFYSLMLDSDEEASSKECKMIRDKVKSHRLWELNEDDINYILGHLVAVLKNDNNGNIFAELMLLEKLYGLYTIADLWDQVVDDYCIGKYLWFPFYALSSMRRFGYCLLHQHLIQSMTSRFMSTINIKDVVDRYIYPICSDMFKKILKTVLKLLENCDDYQRVDILCELVQVCRKNKESVFSDDVISTLLEIPQDFFAEFIKAMNGINVIQDNSFDFGLKLLGIVKLEDSEGMKDYLKILSTKSYKEQFYDPKYKNIEYKLLYDISFYDLTFTKKHTVSKQELHKLFNPNSKRYKK